MKLPLEAFGLIVWTVSALGVAYIAGHSYITKKFRETMFDFIPIVVMLLECPACLGFWLGFFFGLVLGGFANAITLACYTAGSNFILAKFTGLMDVA